MKDQAIIESLGFEQDIHDKDLWHYVFDEDTSISVRHYDSAPISLFINTFARRLFDLAHSRGGDSRMMALKKIMGCS